MSSSFTIFFDGQAADPTFYNDVMSLEVEENLDLPGAIQFTLPVNRTPTADLTYVSDTRLRPLANVAVVINPAGNSVTGAMGGGTPPLGDQCIFDGYVLSHKLHLDPGVANSTLAVWGQDASWLMNMTEKVQEWVDVSDVDAANQIFQIYGIIPDPGNTVAPSPMHPESGHTLMQRGSDIQFLRTLARRNGRICRVMCVDKPGVRFGFFAPPELDGVPVAMLSATDPTGWMISSIDIEWDATKATAVVAHQAVFSDASQQGVAADIDDAGLPLLSTRKLVTFTGQPMSVLLAAPVDDAGELTERAQSLLRDSGWFVRCEGETDVARLGVILRAGTLVLLTDVGSLHSGNYLVWSVRHTITKDAHKMKFVLVRNAVGSPPTGMPLGPAAAVGAMS